MWQSWPHYTYLQKLDRPYRSAHFQVYGPESRGQVIFTFKPAAR